MALQQSKKNSHKNPKHFRTFIFPTFSSFRVSDFLNPLTANVPHHTETSQFICRANQLTGFYMMGNIGR